MSGSEKQIKWANDILSEQIPTLRDLIARWDKIAVREERQGDDKEVVQETLDEAAQMRSALKKLEDSDNLEAKQVIEAELEQRHNQNAMFWHAFV